MRLLSVFGTRPEAIKMAPILLALRHEPQAQSIVCVSGQHRQLLDQALGFFSIAADYDLDLMEEGQGLNALTSRLIQQLDRILADAAPDRVIVQGDTTTAAAAALAAFHRRIPVAHVEAGLRTYQPHAPWPEEANRRIIALAADLHFAPTALAKANLCSERLHGEVYVTGNSGIDALRHVTARLEADETLRQQIDGALELPGDDRKLVLVTAHRRESFGAPFEEICAALAELARRGDTHIVFPLHPNPALGHHAEQTLGAMANLRLVAPLDLPSCVRLMQRADLILTDSGGVQEEAVALGRPLLVTRQVTERPEAIEAGAARLVGTSKAEILTRMTALLDDPQRAARFASCRDIYGDGGAARRIVDILLGRQVEEFRVEAAAKVTVAAE